MKRLGLFVLCLLATACAPHRVVTVPGNAARPSLYPDSFRAQHQVTLTVAGRQAAFTGYLLVRQNTWRAIAMSEFGVTLFDLLSSPEKGRQALKTSGIPASYLTHQAADMIEVLFLPPQAGEVVTKDSVTRHGVVYEITYSGYTRYRGVKHKIPQHILLENKKMGLRLTADLLKLEPMKIPEAYFAN
jgi:hypothetical protein